MEKAALTFHSSVAGRRLQTSRSATLQVPHPTTKEGPIINNWEQMLFCRCFFFLSMHFYVVLRNSSGLCSAVRLCLCMFVPVLPRTFECESITCELAQAYIKSKRLKLTEINTLLLEVFASPAVASVPWTHRLEYNSSLIPVLLKFVEYQLYISPYLRKS